jgi:hypothetical protein
MFERRKKYSSDSVAGSLEGSIGRMLAYIKSLTSGVTEYSILFDAKKHNTWFIVIFFSDKTQLSNGLENGLCFQIFSYLNNEFIRTPETTNINRSISFVSGNRPKHANEVSNLFEQLIKKEIAANLTAGKGGISECGVCGHNFDNHKLLCNLKDDKTTPTEGWMICPEQDCNCFQIWGADFKAAK